MKASETQIGGSHYRDMPIQPGTFVRKNGIGWYEGNAIKYICRYKQKGGIEDIKKAIHYLQLILEENDTVDEGTRIDELQWNYVIQSTIPPKPIKYPNQGQTGDVPTFNSYLFNNVT